MAATRLLLDEMYPAAIAKGLRARRIDAVAVQGRPELRGLADRDLFVAAQLDRRCVVTENVVDYVAVEAEWRAANDRAHAGLVLVAAKSFPRARRTTISRLVRALAALGGRDTRGAVTWLDPTD